MEEKKSTTESLSNEKKGSKTPFLIIIILLFLFLIGVAYMYFSRSQIQEETLMVTPTEGVSEEIMLEGTPTEDESMMEEDATEETGPTSTPIVNPTNTPAISPTPTSTGPGGLQSNPTNTPTPTSLPLSY